MWSAVTCCRCVELSCQDRTIHWPFLRRSGRDTEGPRLKSLDTEAKTPDSGIEIPHSKVLWQSAMWSAVTCCRCLELSCQDRTIHWPFLRMPGRDTGRPRLKSLDTGSRVPDSGIKIPHSKWLAAQTMWSAVSYSNSSAARVSVRPCGRRRRTPGPGPRGSGSRRRGRRRPRGRRPSYQGQGSSARTSSSG
jgi:hypothetical protein